MFNADRKIIQISELNLANVVINRLIEANTKKKVKLSIRA